MEAVVISTSIFGFLILFVAVLQFFLGLVFLTVPPVIRSVLNFGVIEGYVTKHGKEFKIGNYVRSKSYGLLVFVLISLTFIVGSVYKYWFVAILYIIVAVWYLIVNIKNKTISAGDGAICAFIILASAIVMISVVVKLI